jgi:hypothetical protein
VRGWVRGSIAVLCLALVCAVIVPVAVAAEAPEEAGGVRFELRPRKHAYVRVEIRPELGVAAVYTEIGPHWGARPHRPWGMVDYAARIPKTPIEGRIDLTIPGVLSIDGELTPVGEESLDFDGSFHFTGNGGYLSFEKRHVTGWSASGATSVCPQGCLGPHPSLFDHIEFPLTFTGRNTQVLYASQSLGHRVTHFQATHAQGVAESSFKAQAVEWLPGQVAAMRTIEVVAAPESDFKVSSKAEHPKLATVRPPAPFSGSAAYRRGGTIRSPAIGKLTGSLSVDMFGVKVRLAGPRAKASLINLTPGL